MAFFGERLPLLLIDTQPPFGGFLVELIWLWRLELHLSGRGFRVRQNKLVVDCLSRLCTVEVDALPFTLVVTRAGRAQETSLAEIEALLVTVRQGHQSEAE